MKGPVVPRIMHLNRINRQHEPDEDPLAALGTTLTMPAIARTEREQGLKTDRASSTLNILNAAASSRDLLKRQASNPQFQKLNMAPYLKESREFVKGRQSSRGGARSAL